MEEDIKQLKERVERLEEENRKLQSSTTIPFDIGEAFRARLIDKTKVNYSANNVTNPPTAAEINTAFGNFATVGQGFIGVINDNGDGILVWLCVSTGGGWSYELLTVAT